MRRPLFSSLVLMAACQGEPLAPVLAIGPDSPTTLDDLALQLSPGEELAEGDVLTYDVDWFRDDTEVPDLADATTVPAARTAKGEVWRAVATASDDKDRISLSAEVEVTVVNTVPSVEVEVGPVDARTSDDLVAVANGSDVDDDTVTFSWSWTVDGTDAGITTETVPASATSAGQLWEVTVTPSDDEAAGGPVSAQIRIENTAPEPSSVVISPSEAYEATVLTAVPAGTDLDGDEITWDFSWFVDGTEVGTGETLDGTSFDRGGVVTVEATPSDAQVAGNSVTSGPITILNTPPSVDQAVIDPAAASEASELTCIAGGWADDDGDAEDYRLTWLVDGVDVGSASVLFSEFFSKGQQVVCQLTPWDGLDEGTPVTSAPVTIDNTVPRLADVALSTSSPRTADTLTATVSGGFDLDGDAITYTYQWYVNGSIATSEVTTSGSASLSGATWFDKGDTVYVDVTPNDGEADGTTVSSGSATVVNTAPGAATVEVDPAEPDDKDILYCDITAAAVDADGDSLTYAIDWYVDGSLWTGSTSTTVWTGDTIVAASTTAGQEWECEVVASDGTDDGPAELSGVVEIASSVYIPSVGDTGTYGVISGAGWKVCRADTSSAWVAANSGGTYNADSICKYFGYGGATSVGGTCGTVCGYCGTAGREFYDGGGGSITSLSFTVHWKCE